MVRKVQSTPDAAVWASSPKCIRALQPVWSFQAILAIPKTLAPVRNSNLTPRIGIAYSPDALTGKLPTIDRGSGKHQHPCRFRYFRYGVRRSIRRNHEREPAIRVNLYKPGSSISDEPFRHRRERSELRTAVSASVGSHGATPQHPDPSIDWSRYEPLNGIPAFAPDKGALFRELHVLIERKLGPSTIATASYVGSQAHHLLALIEANPGIRLCVLRWVIPPI